MPVMLRSQTSRLGGYNNPTISYGLENKSFDRLHHSFETRPGQAG
jgi:hypothetical protein